MNDELKTMFRASELQRRQERRKIMSNAVALDNEPLTREEREQDAAIKKELQRMSLQFEKEVTPGYWTRLWAALRGK